MAARLESYIALLNHARSFQPNIMRILNIGYNKFIHPHVDAQLKKQFYFKEDIDHEKYSFAAYKNVENAFILSSQRFLQILDHYMAILKSDRVDFIFTLQPLLYRQVNKALSSTEDQMRRTIFGIGPNMPPELIDRSILMSKYFFDQYLAQASRSRVEQSGYGFMDLNNEIRTLNSDFELYVDYCHFTVPGSKTVAEIIGQKVLQRLPPPKGNRI